MHKSLITAFLFFFTIVSGAWADSQYDGWWFDANWSGSGVSLEIQGDTIFSAAYSYYYGSPVWFTAVSKYNAAKDAYIGKIQIWRNGKDVHAAQ